eukprot:SAG31_NODE_3987_length_3683_cov_4.328962_1_plen_74_part_00
MCRWRKRPTQPTAPAAAHAVGCAAVYVCAVQSRRAARGGAALAGSSAAKFSCMGAADYSNNVNCMVHAQVPSA